MLNAYGFHEIISKTGAQQCPICRKMNSADRNLRLLLRCPHLVSFALCGKGLKHFEFRFHSAGTETGRKILEKMEAGETATAIA